MLTPVIQSGIQGMQSSLQNLSRSAQQIAQTGVSARDAGADINAAITGVSGRPGATKSVAESLIDLKSNVLMFQASAKIVTASDNMIGSLLDVRA